MKERLHKTFTQHHPIHGRYTGNLKGCVAHYYELNKLYLNVLFRKGHVGTVRPLKAVSFFYPGLLGNF